MMNRRDYWIMWRPPGASKKKDNNNSSSSEDSSSTTSSSDSSNEDDRKSVQYYSRDLNPPAEHLKEDLGDLYLDHKMSELTYD